MGWVFFVFVRRLPHGYFDQDYMQEKKNREGEKLEKLTRLSLRDAVLAHQDRLDGALGGLGRAVRTGKVDGKRIDGQQQNRGARREEKRPACLFACPASPVVCAAELVHHHHRHILKSSHV